MIKATPFSAQCRSAAWARLFHAAPATVQLLNSLGVDKLTINTQPDGLHLTLNDQPLPTLAYNSAIAGADHGFGQPVSA